MLQSKQPLSAADLEQQFVLELPARETLALVVIRNVLNGNTLRVNVRNVAVGVQVCALVQAINQLVAARLTCTVRA